MTDRSDARLNSPAVFRNRVLILDVLRTVFAAKGLVLEVASGSGQHGVYFAERLPELTWQPSDPSPSARASIATWGAAAGLANVRPPIDLDASVTPWAVDGADAILAINMVHISPWPTTQGLMCEAGRLLPARSLLYLYGPFVQSTVPLAPSNAAFDLDLRQRDASWGLRHLTAVEAEASKHGLALENVVPMPANNLSLILRRM